MESENLVQSEHVDGIPTNFIKKITRTNTIITLTFLLFRYFFIPWTAVFADPLVPQHSTFLISFHTNSSNR